MSDRYTELEYKFKADHVPVAHFVNVMQSSLPDGYENLTFDDVYWKRGAICVRHRLLKGGELTVKARKSQDSIKDRVEINLAFSPETTQEDVEAFLLATGYERLFTLRKLIAHVFHYGDVEVAIYEVGRVDNWGISGVRQFIEIEVKTRSFSKEEASGVLDIWKFWFQREFCLSEPINQSLLEIYTSLSSPSTNYRI
jgi:adenylate cyclase class IV